MKRETITCGCCRGPAEDRCACWIHRYTTPEKLSATIDGRHVAHACSACAAPKLDAIEALAEQAAIARLTDSEPTWMAEGRELIERAG